MSTSVIPKLHRILAGGRGKPSASDAAKVAMALAVLTGLAQVMEPAPVLAATPGAMPGVARIAVPGRPDEATAAAFQAAVARGVPDAAFLRAILAERVAAKRVVAEAMRAGLSTDEPDASLPSSPKGQGVPLRDVRPFEDAVDASFEGALRADPAHADLIAAVHGQRAAAAEVGHQADVIAGVDEEPEAPAFR